MSYVYIVSVNLTIYSDSGTSTTLEKYKHAFLNSDKAQEKAEYYRKSVKSSPNKVYTVEVRCLEVE